MITTELDTSTIIEDLKKNEVGKAVQILPDTYAIKIKKQRYRTGNSYFVKHLNQRDVLLIDTVHNASKQTLKSLMEKGYNIAGLLLTHGDLVSQAYIDLETLSKMIDAPIFIHPFDSGTQHSATLDITEPHALFEAFSLKIYNYPGHTGGSVLIYSEINNGMLFTGDCAVGAPYEDADFYFERPPIEDISKDVGLAVNWKRFVLPFKHILPLHGKPQFYLTEGGQKNVILQLGKDVPTSSL